jgi:hypothetical protein
MPSVSRSGSGALRVAWTRGLASPYSCARRMVPPSRLPMSNTCTRSRHFVSRRATSAGPVRHLLEPAQVFCHTVATSEARWQIQPLKLMQSAVFDPLAWSAACSIFSGELISRRVSDLRAASYSRPSMTAAGPPERTQRFGRSPRHRNDGSTPTQQIFPPAAGLEQTTKRVSCADYPQSARTNPNVRGTNVPRVVFRGTNVPRVFRGTNVPRV